MQISEHLLICINDNLISVINVRTGVQNADWTKEYCTYPVNNNKRLFPNIFCIQM